MREKTTQTFDLSEEDVRAAIQDWIIKHHGAGQAIDVHIQVGTRTTGIGMNEHDEHVVEISASRTVVK